MLIQDEIVNSAVKNSITFLRKAIDEITLHDDTSDAPISVEIAIISISFIQMSFELILVAHAIKSHGLRSILLKRDAQKSDAEIEALFMSQKLGTQRFGDIKNNLDIFGNIITKESLHLVKNFQNIRNKLIHLCYIFDDNELYDIKYEIIYYIVHVIVPIFCHGDDIITSSIAIESVVGSASYNKLVSFRPYVEKMEELARISSHDVFACFYCGHRSFAVEAEVCFVCNHMYDDFERADCGRCGARHSVLFDSLNILINHNMMRGVCLSCGEDDVVFKCPKCGISHCLEASIGKDTCYEGHCAIFDD